MTTPERALIALSEDRQRLEDDCPCCGGFYALYTMMHRQPCPECGGATGMPDRTVADDEMTDETPFIVTHSVDTHTEKQLGAFASERLARTYTRRWSKQHHGICILRGPIKEDECGQNFVLAIFDNGEEVEDCDHS